MNITVGAIVGVFGLKGDFKVKQTVDNEEILQSLETVTIKKKNGEQSEHKVENIRFHKGQWLVKVEGINTPEAAMMYKGSVFILPEEELPEIDTDEVYWIHIKGFPVVDTAGKRIGFLADFLETGTHDVFQIAGDDGKEYMISNNPSHVLKIDMDKKEVLIDRIGLVDNEV